jgi:hypothetical protein
MGASQLAIFIHLRLAMTLSLKIAIKLFKEVSED